MGLPLSTLAIGATLAVFVGVSLGLLGGGGSILTVPILVYVLGQSTHVAIATSLLVVGTTSLAALVPHARARRVRWRTGVAFGASSMVGAFAGGRVAHFVPGGVLLIGFGAMMVVTAIAMMRGRRDVVGDAGRAIGYGAIAVQGLFVGSVTGLVGAGGGFLVVPALVLLGGLPMSEAIGTSLLVIAMNTFAGLAGALATTTIDPVIASSVTTAAVIGSFAGTMIAARVPQEMLRRGFAWLIVVMAVFVLAQEIPRALGYDVALTRDWPWVLGLTLIPAIVAVIALARGRSSVACTARAARIAA